MTYTTYTKNFIREFNFANPDWDNLPEGFPYCNISSLTRGEKYLYGGIKTAWLVSQPPSYFVKRAFYKSAIITSGLFIFMGIIMFSYYMNINFNLGLNFLTDFFA